MSATWSTGATSVLERANEGWPGVWSLLFAAGKAAFRLSLQLPIGVGAALAFAAADTCEARDEVGWEHPDLPMTALAVDLGPLGPQVDLPAACGVVADLLDGALDRLCALAATGRTSDEQQLAQRLGWRIREIRRAVVAVHA
ncbi:MAG: hypothetical protein J0I40_02880 [Cellulomonas sp.]|uniref:hypothetical protein n=1 Tax=Cellulomonas sp. 73-92 TaxID=1895740 RepID=UPI00092B28DA|nr:hypothetical protein [Cellulomonas sp. 73-92]MBN9374337.1 hypothetical protein [Cellulomonas sp.]OJV75518.1 MAG: hypothetical protein BGO37_01445 [Cellulomonas sp. 73-92]